MPRRPAKITQGEIARAIRAAKEAGAAEVVIDREGQIRVVLSLNATVTSTSPPKDEHGHTHSANPTAHIVAKVDCHCGAPVISVTDRKATLRYALSQMLFIATPEEGSHE